MSLVFNLIVECSDHELVTENSANLFQRFAFGRNPKVLEGSIDVISIRGLSN